ncbi:MAG: replicative DNA helicase [Chloroflexi bacterium]|nr:replicative DNA helicase [Chloroflexota bacterium]
MDHQAPHTQLHVPMSLEAEQALLGSILIEPRTFLTVASLLSAADFFIKRHEYIWNAISRLQERNDAVDYLTLASELQDMRVLDEVGGQAYLTSLVNNTPTAIHAEVYAEMVARTATRRRMLQAADNIRQVALDEELPIDKVIDEAEQALFAVSNNRVKREFVPIWDAASEYYDEMEKLLEIGAGTIGMPTGFNDLDGLLGGFQKSDLVVFAGRPGMGKTSWMLSVALNVARRDRRVAIFTMEMGVEQMVQRLISMETGIAIKQLRTADISAREHTRLTEAIGRISSLPLFIDDTPSISPIEMRTKCRRLQHEYGLDIVMVDYMQLMSAGRAYENNRVQEISYISRSLKELARELNVTVLSTAQLSRAVEQRQDKRPQLSDLRESGTIEQDADAVLFLYRDAVYNPDTTEFPNQAHVMLSKHRHGPTGVVHLEFQNSFTRFKDVKKVNFELADISNLD